MPKQNHSKLREVTVKETTTVLPTDSMETPSTLSAASSSLASSKLSRVEAAAPVAHETAPVAHETTPVAQETAAVAHETAAVTKKTDDIFDFPITVGAAKPSSNLKMFDDEIEDLFASSSLIKTGAVCLILCFTMFHLMVYKGIVSLRKSFFSYIVSCAKYSFRDST